MLDPKSRAAVKYISFDLYGTLFLYDNLTNSWRDWAEVFYNRFRALGLDAPFPEFHDSCQQFFSKPVEQLDAHTVFASRIVQFGHTLELNIDADTAHDIADDCCEAWQQHISIHPQAKTLLEQLEPHYELFLISNFDHPPFVRKLLEDNGIAMHFEHIVISGEVGSKKPETAILAPLKTRFELNYDNCLHIGDSMDDYHFSINNDLKPVMIGEQGKVNGAIDFHLNETAALNDVLIVEDLGHLIDVLKVTKTKED